MERTDRQTLFHSTIPAAAGGPLMIFSLKETQIGYSHTEDDINAINRLLNIYKKSYNNNQPRFNSIVICHENQYINMLEYDHFPGFSFINLKKDKFCDKVFCLSLLYKNVWTLSDVFVYHLPEIIGSNPIDLVSGDFNINGLASNQSSLLNSMLHDYQLQLDFSTHLDAGTLHHTVYTHTMW